MMVVMVVMGRRTHGGIYESRWGWSGLMSYTLNLKLLYPLMRKDTIQNIFSPLDLLTLSLTLWTLGPSVFISLNDPLFPRESWRCTIPLGHTNDGPSRPIHVKIAK